jgi:nucleoside-diphosphate-sugar epimerase
MSSARTALLIGGTGPTGPFLLRGLEERGFDVTLCHTGRHEVDEVAHVEHIHSSVHDVDELAAALGTRSFDVAVVTYGRLRGIAELLVSRVSKFVSIGGVPAYRGYFDPHRFDPPGLPVPTLEDAPTATEADDGKSYRIRRTEEMLLQHHPTASHFRYPMVYGPRQIAPREWCITRRVLDGRKRMVVPDGGLTLATAGYVENLAHGVLLALDTDAGDGEIFNIGDEEVLTLRQVIDIITTELNHDLALVDMPMDLAIPGWPMIGAPQTSHRVLGIEKLTRLLGYRDRVPARAAMAATARWQAENPPEPGGAEEQTLEDPFDYEAEDRLMDGWIAATASVPIFDGDVRPGFGLSYAGPGATKHRADTRI